MSTPVWPHPDALYPHHAQLDPGCADDDGEPIDTDPPDDLCGLCGFHRAEPGYTACRGCA